MNFRGTFCHPMQRKIIELGDIPAGKVIETFKKTDWKKYLELMDADPDHIEYSPSLEIENKDNLHGITISTLGSADEFEFYLFYKRPKRVKKLFGFYSTMDEEYMTDITGQSEQDALDCLNALLRDDLAFLDDKIK